MQPLQAGPDGRGDAAADHHRIQVQRSRQHRAHPGQPVQGVLHDPDGDGVALFGQAEDVVRAHLLRGPPGQPGPTALPPVGARRTGLLRPSAPRIAPHRVGGLRGGDRGRRGLPDGLAHRSGALHAGDQPQHGQLPGTTAALAQQLAPEHQARAVALPRQQQGEALLGARRVQCQLGQRGEVGVVLHPADPAALGEQIRQSGVHQLPVLVGPLRGVPGGIHRGGDPEDHAAHPLRFDPGDAQGRVHDGAHLLAAPGGLRRDPLGRARGLSGLGDGEVLGALGEPEIPPGQVRDARGDPVLPGVHPHHERLLRGEGVAQGGPALGVGDAGGAGVPGGAQPALFGQLPAHRQHGGAGQPRAAHQIAGRGRPSRPHRVQDGAGVETAQQGGGAAAGRVRSRHEAPSFHVVVASIIFTVYI